MKPEKLIDLSFDPENFAEVVDTMYDMGSAFAIAERELDDDNDGKLDFELDDIFAVIKASPIIQEIYRDRKVFFAGLVQLNKNTAVEAVLAARDKVVVEYGDLRLITLPFYSFLYAAANSYAIGAETVEQAQSMLDKAKQQVEMWKLLFKSGNVFPETFGNKQ